MVILENIKLNDTGIECDYNPEKSGILGHISLDRRGKFNIQYSGYEYGKQTYARKALSKLNALLQEGENIPKQTAVTWY